MIEENKNQTWSETDTFTIERYKQFSKYLQPNSTVLDIGCNTGRGGKEIKRIFPKIDLYGVDLIKERLDRIPAGIYKSTQACSVEEAVFSDNFFEYIVAGEIIEHLPMNILNDVLNSCYRILKPKGQLILTTPNPNSLLVKLGRRNVFNDPSHVNILDSKQLKQIAQDRLFKVKSIKGSGKSTRYLGQSFPLLSLYGSYLMILEK